MTTMLMECAVCFQKKGPDLMLSNDTCHGCAERQRLCQKCINGTVAKSWVDGACPICGDEPSDGSQTDTPSTSSDHQHISNQRNKPILITFLRATGTIIGLLSVLAAVYLLNLNVEDVFMGLNLVWGVSTAVSGFILFLILEGIATIIEQLHEASQE